MAAGKYDFTAKWWDPARFQEVVDHFAGRIQFVQCGEAGHWHPKLRGVIDLVGQDRLRQFVRLMYHASGVVCPVTFAMHLAAAVEVQPGRPKNRACVVIAGGREPSQWEKYGHHRFLETNGALLCCDDGGCWKSGARPSATATEGPAGKASASRRWPSRPGSHPQVHGPDHGPGRDPRDRTYHRAGP